jgi:hypothetical protein
MVKRFRKNIYLSLPNLAPLRLGGRNFQIREFSTPENLRQSRKFQARVVRSKGGVEARPYIFCVSTNQFGVPDDTNSEKQFVSVWQAKPGSP